MKQLRRRGQAGITVIELLFVMLIGGIALVPVLGLVTFTMSKREPVRTANDSASQLRLFRTSIARDWAGAGEVHTGFAASSSADQDKFECNHGVVWGNARIAIVYTGKRNGGGNPNDPQRILYEIKANADGTKSLVRRECRHNVVAGSTWPSQSSSGSVQNDTASGGVDGGPRGSARVIVRRVQDLIVPRSCNPTFSGTFVPCDMNVTVTTTDGQSATVRLRQEIGRKS